MPIPVWLAAAGAGLQVLGIVSQGNAAQAAARSNAVNARRDAELARQQAIEDEKAFRNAVLREAGLNIAAIGASGLQMTGSALDALADNARQAEQDALRIRMGAEIEAVRFSRQIRAERLAGGEAGRAASLLAAGTAFRGGAELFSYSKKPASTKLTNVTAFYDVGDQDDLITRKRAIFQGSV